MSEGCQDKLTVIIPAYNEEACIADSIRSLQSQTVPPDEIIVIDDCSSDRTGEVAASCGAHVLRPARNTGSKAGAQNFALAVVKNEYTLTIDADTTLAADAIEKLMPAIREDGVAAACGFVLPRYVRSLWERGRYIEYLFAFSYYKRIQDYYNRPLISSGCFSVYRTSILQANGGWSERTRAEDMDLTWHFYEAGYKVRFVPEAFSYPIEPHNFAFMRKQLKRWSHGYIQNLRLHWRLVSQIPYLRLVVAVSLWDALVASIIYLALLPLLALVLREPLFLIGYVIDALVLLVPVLFEAIPRRQTLLALSCLPAFLVLRVVNAYFFLEAIWSEIVIRKPLLVYEKGH